MKREKTRDQVVTFVQAVAAHQDWRVNPDREFLDSIIDGLYTNFNRYGYFLCPCRESWGEQEKDRDVICPCVYAKEDLEEYGNCYCGLFVSKEHLNTGREVESIPERRPEEKIP